MSRHYWRKGGHEHLALARYMFGRQAESYGATMENADAAWTEKDIAQFWLDEAWACLQFIHAKMKETGASLAPDPEYTEEQDKAWRIPSSLCPNDIHDFQHDDELGTMYCGKCTWWSPDR